MCFGYLPWEFGKHSVNWFGHHCIELALVGSRGRDDGEELACLGDTVASVVVRVVALVDG